MKWPPVSAFADEAATKFGVGDASSLTSAPAAHELKNESRYA
jgi:hypothetical protein